MKILFLSVSLLLAAACGDNNKAPSDSSTPGDGSGSNANATLTSYVVDLVTNHTAMPETARPYSEFSALPDPDADANNGSAYSSLF